MSSSKGISIAALVCGVVGIVGLFVSNKPVVAIIALVVAIAGIVLGAIGMKKAKANGESKGLAVAGLVCGIVGTALALIGVICAVCVVCAAKAVIDGLQSSSLLSFLLF